MKSRLSIATAFTLAVIGSGCATDAPVPVDPICVSEASKKWIASNDPQLARDIISHNKLLGRECPR